MIHVLTLNWNGLDKLKRLAVSLNTAVKELDQEVVWHIRDNGSTDGSVEWLQNESKEGPRPEDLESLKFDLLLVDHNRANFSEGVNSLVERANDFGAKIECQTEEEEDDLYFDSFFLLLNNDVVINDRNSLRKMLSLFEGEDGGSIGMVGARLLYNGTDKLQHAGVIFGPRYGNMPYHFRHKETSDANAEKNRYFQAVTAACCFVRYPVMVQLLGLDTKFSWAFEDIDLCLRAGKLGWKIAYCGDTNIYHEESASLKKNPVNKLFMSRNVKHFKKKWFGKYELDHEKYLKDSQYKVLK